MSWQPADQSPGGFAGQRYLELSRRVRLQRRRRRLIALAAASVSYLGAVLLLRPWTWSEIGAYFLVLLGTTATILWAELDEMPAWVNNWKTGQDGELATAEQLASLPDTWRVRHDLDRVPGIRGNLDHAIVGPAGVFALETKNWAGSQLGLVSQRLRRWQPLTSDRPEDAMSAVGQAKSAARNLNGALRTISGQRHWVTPVLVVWANDVLDPARINGVWVVSGPQLATWLKEQPVELAGPSLLEAREAVDRL